MTSPLARLLQAGVRFYQRRISPLSGPRCRYAPTCSSYAHEALSVHGAVKGTLLATWRILRCNPMTRGGYDPVPPRGQWPRKPLGHTELLAQWHAEENAHNSHEPPPGAPSDHHDHGEGSAGNHSSNRS